MQAGWGDDKGSSSGQAVLSRSLQESRIPRCRGRKPWWHLDFSLGLVWKLFRHEKFSGCQRIFQIRVWCAVLTEVVRPQTLSRRERLLSSFWADLLWHSRAQVLGFLGESLGWNGRLCESLPERTIRPVGGSHVLIFFPSQNVFLTLSRFLCGNLFQKILKVHHQLVNKVSGGRTWF